MGSGKSVASTTRVIAGEPLNRGDDDDSQKPEQGGGASVTAIPKTRKPKPTDGGVPEPSA